MKRKGTSILLIVMMLVGSLLTGCGGAESATTTPDASESQASGEPAAESSEVASQAEPDADQFFNYVMYADPRSLDGGMTNYMTDCTMIANFSQTLTEIADVDGAITQVGGGAERWEVSEDGLVYTFHLRDFAWEDGQPVTAEQYANTLYRALNPDLGSVMASALFDVKNAQEYVKGNVGVEAVGIKVIDDKTLEITLGSVTPYFIQLTYSTLFTPTRMDLVEEYGEKYGTEAETVLSCGAFKIGEWEHDVKFTLVKNENYWNADNVLMGQVNFRMIRDRQAIMSELMNGTIDRTSVSSPEWRQKLIGSDQFNYGDYVLSGTYFLIVNTEYESNGVKIFSNEKVRRAISAAIKRDEATLLIKGNMAIPASGFVPSVLQLDGKNYREESAYNGIQSLQASVKDPKALFEEGLAEMGADTNIGAYTIEYLVGSTTAEAKKEAEYFQETLKNSLGLNLEIVQVERAVKSEKAKAGEYGITYSTWYADYNDPSSMLNSWITYKEYHSYNTGYANAQYDNYMDAGNASMDEAERLEMFQKAEALLIEHDCVLIPIYHPKSSMMTAKYVKGFINQNFAPTQFKTVYTVGR